MENPPRCDTTRQASHATILMDELEKMYMKHTKVSYANMYSVFRETGGFKYLDLFYMYAKHL